MADAAHPEEKKGGEEKNKSWLNFSEWGQLLRNRAVDSSLLRRFKFGQKAVGGREHPLFYELQKTLLKKNDHIYEMLRTVEKTWDAQGDAVKLPKAGDEMKGFDTVIPLYHEFGPYSDIDRIPQEVVWFEHGTGLDVEDVTWEIANDANAKKYFWKPDAVIKLLRGDGQPWKTKKYHRIKLNRGTVYHENKRELREDLFIFGHKSLATLDKTLSDYNEQINLEGLQEATIPVEIRTKFGDLTKAMEALRKGVHKIEEKQFDKLNQLKGAITNYFTLWNKMLTEYSPEHVPIVKMRFAHTYRIIKLNVAQEIEEDIRITDAVGAVVKTLKRKRTIPVAFEFRDPFKDEEADLLAEQAEIRSAYNKEIAKINSRLSFIVNMLTSGSFQAELRAAIGACAAQVRRIVELREDEDRKIDMLVEVIKHSDESVKEIIDDNIRYSGWRIKAVLKLPGTTTDEKIRMIAQIILDALKFSTIAENLTRSNKSRFLGALKTTKTVKDDKNADKQVPKTQEEIFYEVLEIMGSRLDSHGVKINLDDSRDVLMKKIAEDNEGVIRGTIDDFLSDNLSSEQAYDRLFALIVAESKKVKNDNLGVRIKGEAMEAKRKRLNEAMEDELRNRKERILELRSIVNKTSIMNNVVKRKADNFYKRPEEAGYGLDEHGYPLEIDPKTGEVLIDRWWRELAQNRWQLEIIASKNGGADMLKNHLGLGVNHSVPFGQRVSGTPKRTQRKIADARFFGYVDLLDTSCLIFSYWDTVRDDLRDGRYHKWSKSVGDYVIEGEGGFDEQRLAPYMKSWGGVSRSKGLYVQRKGVIPKEHMHLHDHGHIASTPYDFENTTGPNGHPNLIPSDEAAVTRKHRMRMPDGSIDPPFDKEPADRKPNKYNPAFDRRGMDVDYTFWGNMYYWRWSGYANEWSENPYPHVSTRGIALYLAYVVASDAYNYDEAAKVLDGHNMDYGVRGSGAHGLDNGGGGVNPLTGRNITELEN
jgi:hypothetical protein